ncbi:hypothetical protein CC80DRAFT_531720 [Byssothecium circinans]|uniref:Rhodopsin domain-containing protein n=1 Tax=Byssothecium circinans TaxID=147558 RepID=A0A6A5UAN2_9PLEO|nr:hypothetical protein CC80DRAFT_531720 [Byssothecium circinans]
MAVIPDSRARASRDSCTGIATAFTIVSILVVGLRVYTRTILVRNFGKDDLAMVAALAITVAYLIAIFIIRENGMGLSGKDLTMDQMLAIIQTTLGIELIYYPCVFFIKLSILFCYLRIGRFPTLSTRRKALTEASAAVKSFERITKYTIYFLAIFCLVCLITTLTQCIPIHKMWDFTGMVKGSCINTTAFFYTTSAVNIITDIWIIALPVRTLLKIQRPSHEKFALIVVFSLGVFSCIASIVRLHAIRIYTESPDPFYDSAPINLWSMVEINIGIWCASIPSLKALITRRRHGSSTHASSGYQYHSKGTDRSGTTATQNSIGEIIGSSHASSNGRTRKFTGERDLESVDLVTLDTRRDSEITPQVQRPQQVARKQSEADSAWSGGGADGRIGGSAESSDGSTWICSPDSASKA